MLAGESGALARNAALVRRDGLCGRRRDHEGAET
jgi:hypothetical protein